MSSSLQEQDMAANINKEEAEEEEKEEEESRLDKCSIATKENGGGKAVRFTDTVIITATGGKVSPKVEEEEESQNVGNAQTAVSVDDGTSKDGKESGEKSNNNDNEDSLLGKMFHVKRREDDDAKKSLIPTTIEYESDATPGTDATPRTTTASISSLFFSPCMHMLAIFSLLLVVGLLPILTRTALHFRNKNNKNTNNRPSLMPTSSISPKMNEDVLRIRSFLQFYYLTQEEFSPSSPQERAVDWIIHQDNVSQFPTTGNGVKALLQRWILAVFAFTTQHEHWHACGAPPQSLSSSPPDPLLLNINKKTACHVDVWDLSTDESISNTYYYWLSHDHECTWYGVTCDENGNVMRLELRTYNLYVLFEKTL
uniref:Leucine-rich repeat-containing N-terminal plant-type domain-containing protein n=1 Tax=Ditylum brightwellii TaxID=49249 RepID=A0A7S4SGE0_9STRA